MVERQKRYWLDHRQNVDKVYRTVWTICGLLLLAELAVDKHGDFALEDWFGFHGFFGFAACVGLVLAAKGLRRILMRREDYYDR
jgi:hypothetical protein